MSDIRIPRGRDADVEGDVYLETSRESGGSISHFRQFWKVAVARKWLVLAMTITIFAVAAAQVYTATPIYTSTTILQIDPRNPKVLPYEEVADSSRVSLYSSMEEVQTQARKLQTRKLARRVIDELDLDAHAAFNQPIRRGFLFDATFGTLGRVKRALAGRAGSSDASSEPSTAQTDLLINRFLGSLAVEPVRNTRLIAIAFRSPDPDLAAVVVAEIATQFVELQFEDKIDATRRATAFLREQLDTMEVMVEQSENRLLEYASEKDIVNLSERDTINSKKMADLNDDLTKSEAAVIEKRASYDASIKASVTEFPKILSNPLIESLESQRGKLERDLASLTDRFGADWPRTKALRNETAELGEQIIVEKQAAIRKAREEYQLAQRRYDGLAAAFDRQRERVGRLDRDSVDYQILDREVATNRELYNGLLERLKQADVAEGLRSSNVHIVDEPVVPRAPTFPKKVRTLFLALILGLFCGLGAAFGAELLDNTINDLEDVTHELGMAVLGFVPRLVGGDVPRRNPSGSGARGKPTIAYDEGRRFQNRGWEAYRSLRTSILLSHSGKPPQVIVVTSALPAEGKSTTAVNTAIALAQTGARTVILDLDLRRPSLGKLFDASAAQGMSTFLSGNSELLPLIRDTGYPNLSLVLSGPAAPNPAELLGSKRMEAGLIELRSAFDCIVIDTPPSLQLTDARVLSPYVDGTMLVVRAGRTPKDAIRRVREYFTSVGAPLLGVVVNGIDVKEADYGYYYHGDYYADGDPGDDVTSPAPKRMTETAKRS